MANPQSADAQIAEAAFYIWLDEGRPEGRAQEHWLRAQQALNGKRKAPAARKATAKKASDTKAKASAKKAPAKPATRKTRAAKPA